MLDFGMPRTVGGQLPCGFFQPEPRAENRTKRSFEGQLTVSAHPSASQPDVIQAHEPRPIARHECKRGASKESLAPEAAITFSPTRQC